MKVAVTEDTKNVESSDRRYGNRIWLVEAGSRQGIASVPSLQAWVQSIAAAAALRPGEGALADGGVPRRRCSSNLLL